MGGDAAPADEDDPVVRRTVAVPFSEALIAGSQDDSLARPPCGT